MKATTPYCRVYWSILEDERFDTVRDDMSALGSWTLCLVVADMAYPVPAFWPPTIPQSARDTLVQSGLIEDVGGVRFRVHGLASERENRSQTARDAAAVRWQKPSDAHAMRPHAEPASDGNAKPMPSRAEPSKAEPSTPARTRDELEGLRVPDAVAKAWEEATGRTFLASGRFASEYLDDACKRHEAYDVIVKIKRARAQFPHVPEVSALAMAVKALLDPPLSKDAVKAPPSRPVGRKDPAVLKSAHYAGQHDDAPAAGCSMCEGAA